MINKKTLEGILYVGGVSIAVVSSLVFDKITMNVLRKGQTKILNQYDKCYSKNE